MSPATKERPTAASTDERLLGEQQRLRALEDELSKAHERQQRDRAPDRIKHDIQQQQARLEAAQREAGVRAYRERFVSTHLDILDKWNTWIAEGIEIIREHDAFCRQIVARGTPREALYGLQIPNLARTFRRMVRSPDMLERARVVVRDLRKRHGAK